MFVTKDLRILEIDVTVAPAVGLTFPFPVDMELEGKKFSALESFSFTQLRNSANNIQVVSDTEGADITCFFQVASTLKVYGVPYMALNTQSNRGIIRQFAQLPINLQKSYIMINGTGAMVINRSLVFAFHF